MLEKIKYPNFVKEENKIHHEGIELEEEIRRGEHNIAKGMKKKCGG